MPPQVRFTREEIAECAFEIAREKGLEAVTSREVGLRIGCSTRPIFTAFKNMDEVKAEVRKMAHRCLYDILDEAADFKPVFKRYGMQMIRFAQVEPELFKILFMREHEQAENVENIIDGMGEITDICRDIIARDYNLTQEEARIMFMHLWTSTYGISVMCALKVCKFTEEEIAEMLGREFAGMMMLIKSGNMEMFYIKPEKKPE